MFNRERYDRHVDYWDNRLSRADKHVREIDKEIASLKKLHVAGHLSSQTPIKEAEARRKQVLNNIDDCHDRLWVLDMIRELTTGVTE